MATAKIQEELEAIVMCAICLNNMAERDGRMLSACGHGFCLQCLKQLQVTQSQEYYPLLRPAPFVERITCPTCRDTTWLPLGSVENLKKYFVVGKLAGVISTLEKEDKYYVCGRCQKGHPPVKYCFDCVRLFCHICQPKHDEKKSNNSHVTTTITRDTVSSLLCQVHCEYIVDFCIQCKVITCESCHDSLLHKDHDIRPFFLKRQDPAIVNMKAEIAECEQTLRDVTLYRAETKIRLDKEKEEIDKLVKDAVDKGKDLKSKLDASVGPLDMTHKTLQDWKNNRQQLYVTHGNLLTPLADLPHLSLTGIDDIVIPQSLSAVIDTLPEYTPLEFVADTTQVKQLTIGRIQCRTEQAPLNIAAGKQMKQKLPMKPCVDVRPKGDITSLVLNIKAEATSLDFLPNGAILSVVGQQLAAHNQKGQLLSLPTKVDIPISASDVAVHQQTGNVVVCSQDEGVFELTLFNTYNPYGRQSTQLEGMSTDVTYTPDGSVLASKYSWSAYDTHYIVKLTNDGCEVWMEELDHGCEHMTVYNNGRIVASHFDDGLHIYAANMDKLHTIQDKIHLPSPRGVCTDSQDNLYVVDGKRGVVCLYSNEWKYITDIITGLDTGPYEDTDMDIAIYKDKLLVVCHGQYDTRCISLFSI